MHNTFIIARREYLERVRSRAFVIMTFFIPALMLGVTVLPTMLMQNGSNETKRMVVVAADRAPQDTLLQFAGVLLPLVWWLGVARHMASSTPMRPVRQAA